MAASEQAPDRTASMSCCSAADPIGGLTAAASAASAAPGAVRLSLATVSGPRSFPPEKCAPTRSQAMSAGVRVGCERLLEDVGKCAEFVLVGAAGVEAAGVEPVWAGDEFLEDFVAGYRGTAGEFVEVRRGEVFAYWLHVEFECALDLAGQ